MQRVEHLWRPSLRTSVFAHNCGVETLWLLEGDSQRGATADAQTHHGRGLWGACAGGKFVVSTKDCSRADRLAIIEY